MNFKALKLATIALSLACASSVNADTSWSTQDYDLYSGDFNGDDKTDILYIAKDAAKSSGIATSEGGVPATPLQSWSSNFLGIQWYGRQYKAVVGDFNNDSRSDVLLQSATPSNSFLLLADVNGRLTSIAQTISSSYLGLAWSSNQHTILGGDLSGDNYDDLFFQAADPSEINAIPLPSFNGLFINDPIQTFTDTSWPVFKWSREHSVINVGDFNGDGLSDLLIQPRHSWVFVGFDILIPIPVYTPNSFGIAYSQGGATPLQQVGVQQWDRFDNGVDWAPSTATPVIGDFNGDGCDDVLLQAQNTGQPSYLLTGNASGIAFSTPTLVTSNVSISADGARLLAISVGGNAAGLYVQTTLPSGINYFATSVGATISAAVHDPAAVEVEAVNYSYDARGRLKKVTRTGSINNNLQTQYTYDKANNRKSVVTTGSK